MAVESKRCGTKSSHGDDDMTDTIVWEFFQASSVAFSKPAKVDLVE